MKYRKLRIAWSVGWGVVAVFLCVLWVRSHRFNDVLQGHVVGVHNFILTSSGGRVNLTHVEIPHAMLPWGYSSTEANGFPTRQMPLWPDEQVFGYKRGVDHYHVVAPHWSFALLSIPCGVAAWMRWSKRFSLRTLLIATTLVAAIFGFVVWLSR